MKRSYASTTTTTTTTTLYTSPPLESTLIFETGERPSQCVGSVLSLPLTGSLSSGVKLFQYNRFFWNKDLFSFNYENCCIFVAIAWYRGTSSEKATFVFYPIYLPRTTIAKIQSLRNNITLDPKARKLLIDDVLYYLNGAFTGFNFDSSSGSIPAPGIGYPPQYKLTSGPVLYSHYLKGFLKEPTTNHTNFPIFQSSREPPLKFIYVSSNNQIALVRNEVFWDDDDNYPNGASIAFQLITPDSYFLIGDTTDGEKIASHRGGSTPTIYTNTTKNFFVPSIYNDSDETFSTSNVENGWCGSGAYGLGFAMSFLKKEKIYSDVFEGNSYARRELFNKTNWDTDSNLSFSSTSNFEKWAKDNKLETFIVHATKICSLLPSRFLSVNSNKLTRNQKIAPRSNNPILSNSQTMGIVYLDLDYNRTKLDETQSGEANFKKVGSFTPVHSMNPMFSVQALDLSVSNEWGGVLQNFTIPAGTFELTYANGYQTGSTPLYSSYSSFQDGNYISLLEGEMGFNNGVFNSPPAWLAALNPNTAGGNTSPLIASFSTYLSQFAYGLFYRKPYNISSGAIQVQLPTEFAPNIPKSTNLIHFGRLLGQ